MISKTISHKKTKSELQKLQKAIYGFVEHSRNFCSVISQTAQEAGKI